MTDPRLSALLDRALQVYAETLEADDPKLAFQAAKDILAMASLSFGEAGVTEVRIILDTNESS